MIKYNSKSKIINSFFIISCTMITLLFSLSMTSISTEIKKYRVNNPKYNKQISFSEDTQILVADLDRLLKDDNISVILKKYRADNMILETFLNTKGYFYVEDMKSGEFFTEEDFFAEDNIAIFSNTFNGEKSLEIIDEKGEVEIIELEEKGTTYSKEPKVTLPKALFNSYVGNGDVVLNNINVILSGSEKEIENAINKINANLLVGDSEIIVNDYFAYNTEGEWKSLMRSLALMIFIAFLNTLGISYFLVTDSTKEIMLKKVVGASNFIILYEFFKYFGGISLKAFILGVGTQIILSVFNNGYLMGLNLNINFVSLGIAFIFVMIFAIISMIPFLFYITKIEPVMITRKG